MAAYSYLDASAITKLVIREPESDAIETYLVGREALVSSWLSEPEVLRAARRTARHSATDRMCEQVQEALDAIFLQAVDADVLRRAGLIDPPTLRAGDAIHLATALSIDDPELEFVTYDQRLARAAEASGLRVVQPGVPTKATVPNVS